MAGSAKITPPIYNDAMEALLVWTLGGVAVVVLLWRSRTASTIALAAALVASTAAGQALWAARSASRQRSAAAVLARVPQAAPHDGYVSSDACGACHPTEYATWHRSYHRTMTQAATATAVRAPFAGETLTADDGRSYRLRRDGDELWADISGIGARRIGMMTGSHHMQAFWLPGSSGNEQLEFPFTYLFDDRRWVPRRDVFLVGTEYVEGAVGVEPHLRRVPRHRRPARARCAHRRVVEPRRRAGHRVRGVPRPRRASRRRQRQSVPPRLATRQRRRRRYDSSIRRA